MTTGLMNLMDVQSNTPIPTPDLEHSLVAPMRIVVGVPVIGVPIEAFWPRRGRFRLQAVVAFLGLLAAAIDTVWVVMHLSSVDGDLAAHGQIGGEGSLAFDGPAILTWEIGRASCRERSCGQGG